MNLVFVAEDVRVFDDVRATHGADAMASAARDAILALVPKQRC
jgi:hypothetical protein